MEEGVVTFARSWVLLLLVLPAALVLWQWTRAPRRLNLLLKAAMLTLVILALAEPAVTISENKVSTMVLVDTSAACRETIWSAPPNSCRRWTPHAAVTGCR